jgi:hypothetical protein
MHSLQLGPTQVSPFITSIQIVVEFLTSAIKSEKRELELERKKLIYLQKIERFLTLCELSKVIGYKINIQYTKISLQSTIA